MRMPTTGPGYGNTTALHIVDAQLGLPKKFCLCFWTSAGEMGEMCLDAVV